jgi:peroxiredoxin
MPVTYLDEPLYLVDSPTEVGYASEAVELFDRSGAPHTVGGMKRGVLQVVIALPNLSTPFAQMAQAVIDQVGSPEGIELSVVLSRLGGESLNAPEWVRELADESGLFGGLYGLQIEDGLLSESLTPALYLISRDGAIFYKEVPMQIPCSFNLERFNYEANRALSIYNGQGCHA